MWNNSFPTVSVTIPYWLVKLMDDIYQTNGLQSCISPLRV